MYATFFLIKILFNYKIINRRLINSGTDRTDIAKIAMSFFFDSDIINKILKGENLMEENKEEHIRKKKKKEKTGLKYELLDLLKTFIVCFIVVFLLSHFVVKPVQVDGDSMYPTLENQEIGLVNVFSAKHLGINRFDVVVVKHEETNDNWVKRVIGMPKDTVYAKDDVVYVNGKAIEEPYLDSDYVSQIRRQGKKFTEDFDPVTLGEDEYFLMGDNRVVSYDSRAVGAFKKEDIIGKDAYILYPFSKMKIVGNPIE